MAAGMDLTAEATEAARQKQTSLDRLVSFAAWRRQDGELLVSCLADAVAIMPNRINQILWNLILETAPLGGKRDQPVVFHHCRQPHFSGSAKFHRF